MYVNKAIKPTGKGEAFFVLGGQFGSEAKGAAVAWLIESGQMEFDAYVCNHGAQAGHTAYVNGEKLVTFHLPTGLVVDYHANKKEQVAFLDAGSVIDVDMLMNEIRDCGVPKHCVLVHPMASVITDECKQASRAPGSPSEARSGVQKGVGQAIARRALRTGRVARDEPRLKGLIADNPMWCDHWLKRGHRMLVEVPQGSSLSLSHSGFYPYTTSRDCTVMTAMNDAGIHPKYFGGSMIVLRTFAIRVGNIKAPDGSPLGYSGDVLPDQKETSWDDLGVEAEITTVSKRVRRVFTFSKDQLHQTVALTHPDVVFLSFCNYATAPQLVDIVNSIRDAVDSQTPVVFQWGPTSADVGALSGALSHCKGA